MTFKEVARAVEYEARYHLYAALPLGDEDPAWSERVGHPPMCDRVDCPVFREDEKGDRTLGTLGRSMWVYYSEYRDEWQTTTMRKMLRLDKIKPGQKIRFLRYGEKV